MENVKILKCPQCKSEKIHCNLRNNAFGEIERNCRCSGCGFHWHDLLQKPAIFFSKIDKKGRLTMGFDVMRKLGIIAGDKVRVTEMEKVAK